MPFYEFECPYCHAREEIMLPMDYELPMICKTCLTEEGWRTQMKRIMSPTPGFVRNPAVPKRRKK